MEARAKSKFPITRVQRENLQSNIEGKILRNKDERE